jgi:hypothetical protein
MRQQNADAERWPGTDLTGRALDSAAAGVVKPSQGIMSAAHAPAPLPEPVTPMWLPALGAALFVLAAVYWLAQPAAPPPVEEPEAPKAQEAEPVPAQAGAAPGQPGHGQPAAAPMPNPADNPAIRRFLEQQKQQH